jgi:hypothetical protein
LRKTQRVLQRGFCAGEIARTDPRIAKFQQCADARTTVDSNAALVAGWFCRPARNRFAPESSNSRAVTWLPRFSSGFDSLNRFTRKLDTSSARARS